MQEIRNLKRETSIPRQKTKHLSNPANTLSLADFVFCDLIELCKDRLPDNSTYTAQLKFSTDFNMMPNFE